MFLKSYRNRSEPIQITSQLLSLPLFDAEKVIQPQGFDLVDQEMFFKHLGELREGGDLTIRDPTKPL